MGTNPWGMTPFGLKFADHLCEIRGESQGAKRKAGLKKAERGKAMDDKLKDKRVLVVDDEPDVLETLEELLPTCKVVKASSFEEAKKQLETQAFDIAVLDIMGVDGYKLLEIANQRKVTAVMLTAHALTTEDTVKSFKAGAAHFIPKDKITEISTFLNDIFDAKSRSKSLWSKWLDRMDSYYSDKFGKNWKEDDKEFWAKFNRYT